MPFEKPEEWESELSQFMDTVKNSDPPGSIADCVRDDTWRQILAYYANENYVMENVAFVSALQPYIGSGSFDMNVGKELYGRFITDSAREQVNLPGGVRRELDEIYAEDEPIAPPDHFEKAYREIVNMCDADTYSRFKLTAKEVQEHLKSQG